MAPTKKRKKKGVDGDGEKSRRRLDRPGRACGGGRMAHGGRAEPSSAERGRIRREAKEEGESYEHEKREHGYADGGKWIQGAIRHPGALHRQLGVPEGEKIPEKKLAKAAHSDNPTLARRARLAETLKGLGHKKD